MAGGTPLLWLAVLKDKLKDKRNDAEAARKITNHYLKRWTIEPSFGDRRTFVSAWA
jgi:hypothetical protein